MGSLDFIANLLKDHPFAFLFPATVLEGPVVTIIAGSLAQAGVLNVGLVFLSALAGDIGGDLFFYGLGRFGREKFLGKYGKYLGLKESHVSSAEEYIRENSFKAIFAAKISHALGLAILFCVGLFRMSFSRFLLYSISISIPKTVAFIATGYFFGTSYNAISQYFNIGSSMAMFFVSFFVIYKVFHYLNRRYHAP